MGIPVGRQQGCRQRLGNPFDRPLGAGGGHPHVDPVRRDAHEQVGPGPRTQFALPVRQSVGRGVTEVIGERHDPHGQAVAGQFVGGGERGRKTGLGSAVIAAVHPQHRRAVEHGGVLVDPVLDPSDEGCGVAGHVRSVAVAGGEVLGANRGTVGRLPPEAGAVDRTRHTAPDHGVLEAEQPEQLGHLGDVSEHVGQVAHPHGPADAVGRGQAQLEVADVRLARDEELVGERVPGSDAEAPGGGQPHQPGPLLGTDGQVVVDHRHLPVEQEIGERRVGLQPREEFIEQLHQPGPERLVRRVPLTVPVRVRHDVHRPCGCGWLAVRHRTIIVAARWPRRPTVPPPDRRGRARRDDSMQRAR